jgi:hypothetical protein
VAVYGELALEEAMGLSQDRINTVGNGKHENSLFYAG